MTVKNMRIAEGISDYLLAHSGLATKAAKLNRL